ncbi:MAG: prenyltransferase/squalene oxidase repeat-containing protein [Phycisphaerales bacterium]
MTQHRRNNSPALFVAILALANPGALTAQEAAPAAPAPAPTPATPATPPPAADAAAPASPPVRPGAENTVLENEITPALDTAVTRGLEALAKQQQDDGSFGSSNLGHNVAITALAGLAFMSDGNLPGRGRYAQNVERAAQAVLANCTETGLIAAETAHGPMYGHGYATLFLGEVYGMTRGGDGTALSQRVHESLVKAVRLIVQTQNEEGGWRYNPVPNDADVSVTICQVMALRSARNAGLEVPRGTIDRAVQYVRLCQAEDGGFKYQLSRGGSLWPRSAAGVASLQYAGIYQDQAVERGIKYLLDNAFPGRNPEGIGAHYFYGHYYAVQAMYLHGGEPWARWWPAAREEILARQGANGLWDDNSIGEAYGTASALIILQMPKRYLPIFQK